MGLIKPDGLSGNYTNRIKQVILESGFEISKEMVIQLDEQNAANFYAEHSSKIFFTDLIRYMTRLLLFLSFFCLDSIVLLQISMLFLNYLDLQNFCICFHIMLLILHAFIIYVDNGIHFLIVNSPCIFIFDRTEKEQRRCKNVEHVKRKIYMFMLFFMIIQFVYLNFKAY